MWPSVCALSGAMKGKPILNVARHVLAMAVGFVFMLVGLGMGVTIALIPIGVPLGLIGAALFLWGLLDCFDKRHEFFE